MASTDNMTADQVNKAIAARGIDVAPVRDLNLLRYILQRDIDTYGDITWVLDLADLKPGDWVFLRGRPGERNSFPWEVLAGQWVSQDPGPVYRIENPAFEKLDQIVYGAKVSLGDKLSSPSGRIVEVSEIWCGGGDLSWVVLSSGDRLPAREVAEALGRTRPLRNHGDTTGYYAYIGQDVLWPSDSFLSQSTWFHLQPESPYSFPIKVRLVLSAQDISRELSVTVTGLMEGRNGPYQGIAGATQTSFFDTECPGYPNDEPFKPEGSNAAEPFEISELSVTRDLVCLAVFRAIRELPNGTSHQEIWDVASNAIGSADGIRLVHRIPTLDP